MKILFLGLFLCMSIAFASKGDKLFWEEVKNTQDIELLRSYQKEYPEGIFYRLAEIKIKRLKKEKHRSDQKSDAPSWIDGNVQYRYFGIGKSNRHYKGIDYQKNVAKSKAKKELLQIFKKQRLSEERRRYFFKNMETDSYIDENLRVYMLVYIPNYLVD